MERKDLMIGDWVTFKDCQHENPMPIKIVAIGFQADEEDDCLVQINGDKGCDIIGIDDEIVGIPLTPEILEKNGFKKLVTYGTEKWISGDIRMNIYSSDGCWRFCADTKRNENSVIYIHFIHELQHALRLCGIEKEIEL